MCFPKEKFLACIDAINETNYSYGNEVLYRNCGFACLNPQQLSSIIWLIGKSYSADPTRSAPKGAFKNKGLGSSFELIADKLLDSDNFNDFYKELKELLNKEYTYTDSDPEILNKTVVLVGKLNQMIKDAMTTIAGGQQDSDNVVSFCSKFLHFMCPHLFFIIDSYSRNGGHALFSTRAKARTLCIPQPEKAPGNLIIDSAVKKHFSEGYLLNHTVELEDPAIRDYYEHCLRAYGLARFLHANGKECAPQIIGDNHSKYMPRLVDSILMRITDLEAE